jgi:hypothetical protein
MTRLPLLCLAIGFIFKDGTCGFLFVDAYRVLIFVYAGLAWLGAAMPALLVRGVRVL